MLLPILTPAGIKEHEPEEGFTEKFSVPLLPNPQPLLFWTLNEWQSGHTHQAAPSKTPQFVAKTTVLIYETPIFRDCFSIVFKPILPVFLNRASARLFSHTSEMLMRFSFDCRRRSLLILGHRKDSCLCSDARISTNPCGDPY